jgi:hypothetical protein
VDADGDVLEGAGFSALRLDTGVYAISYHFHFAGIPTVTANVQVPGTKGAIQVLEPGTDSTLLVVASVASGSQFDAKFHFCIIGPR